MTISLNYAAQAKTPTKQMLLINLPQSHTHDNYYFVQSPLCLEKIYTSYICTNNIYITLEIKQSSLYILSGMQSSIHI